MPTPEISTDPDRIATVRAVHAEHAAARSKASDPARLRAALHALDPGAARSRAEGARRLMEAGDEVGRWTLFSMMHSPDPDFRDAALHSFYMSAYLASLDEHDWDVSAVPTAQELSDEERTTLLTLLDDPDQRVRKNAVKACASFRVRGWESALTERFHAGHSESAAIVEHLASRGNAPAIVLDLIEMRSPDFSASLSSLLRRRALGLAIDDATWERALRLYEERFDVQGDVASQSGTLDFLRLATRRSLPTLYHLAQGALDRGVRGSALRALARVAPDESLVLLLKALRDRPTYRDAISGLYHVAAEHGAFSHEASRIAGAVIWAVENHDLVLLSDSLRYYSDALRLMLLVGGRAERDFLVRQVPLLHPLQLQWLVWTLRGWSLSDVFERLAAHGLAPAEPPVLSKWEQERLQACGPSDMFADALQRAGVGLWTNRESYTSPASHHELLSELDAITGERFSVEAATQSPRSADREGLLVQFVETGGAAPQAVQFGVPDSGDYYNHRHVAAAANAALEARNAPERFVELCDTDVLYLFGIPAEIHAASRALAIPLWEESYDRTRWAMRSPEWLQDRARAEIERALPKPPEAQA